MMGTFDDWQAQKDSQYILIVEYIEQLAKQHNSSLLATTEYLQNQHNNLDIYRKQSNGNFYKATCNFDNSTFSFDVETILTEIKFLLENNQKTHAQQFSEYKLGYSFRNSNYYFKKSELPAIEPVAPSQPQKNAKEIIDEIVAKADIVKIIGKHVELKRSGNEFKGCCPFHGEKTPSFFVNPQKGLYNCFGCGAAGNALTFLKDYKGMTAIEALQELSRQTGINLPNQDNETKLSKPPYENEKKAFNSIASFVTSYNLPQVAALILGISFEYIDVASSRAYINENDFPYEWAVKFDKLLASLVAMAKQGQLKGLVIAYYEPFSFQNTYTSTLPTQPKKEFDYLNTVIDKASLETYLKSIGKDLTQLLELQEPLTTATPQTDSQLSQQVGGQQPTIEIQAKEITDLKVQLASANGTITQQAERISELETKLNELQKPANDNDVLSDRSRTGHLITIALLVDIIKTTPQGFDKRGNPLPPKYASQNKLYEKIEEYGVKGQSAKTLETRFADANKELKDIKPDHKFT